ncbi:MAG: hypothetical protein A3J46_06740 [Candidatus Yanofskybacteria bacterium RIFCSPHIGHO2_02_FULL_41_11]|uniref:PI3K/PI4K catalytic domain-containing protein n=1 Tax=Candidatus Yanofskybacteria bacterium RIFCSPHIGHO2_02_FULL_41_11 TaxID=1802675 RepID=A0A1F8F703_9BACT|nr:MAG: hypothetical protein A3J46_06740 [Candidatus Yanofskybacteria bacterium RIFCSPHIGHO2_02_FULL_41_11]
MQEFIPDAKAFYELESDYYHETKDDLNRFRDAFVDKHRADLMKMWILDIIISNSDRHGGNFLIRGDGLHAIDHGYTLRYNGDSFSKHINLKNGMWQFFNEELPPELVENIKNFLERPGEQQVLEELLTELFGREYALACLKRIKVIGEILIKKGKITGSEYDHFIPIY